MFNKLSKYAPFLVSNPRDEMNCFVIEVSEDLQEDYYLAMIHENMNISHIIVHAQEVEEARTKRISIDAKRSRSFNSGSSNGTLDIKDKTLFKKRVFNQGLPSSISLGMIGV